MWEQVCNLLAPGKLPTCRHNAVQQLLSLSRAMRHEPRRSVHGPLPRSTACPRIDHTVSGGTPDPTGCLYQCAQSSDQRLELRRADRGALGGGAGPARLTLVAAARLRRASQSEEGLPWLPTLPPRTRGMPDDAHLCG